LAAASPNRSRTLIAIGGITIIALVAFAVIRMAAAPSTVALDLSRARVSEKGLYRMAIEPENGPIKQGKIQPWLLKLTTAAGQPVEGAMIVVDGGMPEHDHGLPTSPAVTGYLGAGKYRLDGVKFTMSGWWQLRFAISAASGNDAALFNVKL
jgi:hypothetical protein